jgi:hypothetical protein
MSTLAAITEAENHSAAFNLNVFHLPCGFCYFPPPVAKNQVFSHPSEEFTNM